MLLLNGIVIIIDLVFVIVMVWKKSVVSFWNHLFGIHYEFKEENDSISTKNESTKTEHNSDRLKGNESGIIRSS